MTNQVQDEVTMSAQSPSPSPAPEPVAGDLVKRQRLSTRLWHWTNVLSLLVLLMTGLGIFNAHPRLYWGNYGADADTAWLQIGGDAQRGYVKVGATEIPTTGVLGHWRDEEGAIKN